MIAARDNGDGAKLKVAYVLKRYPRFSETFVVTEILAHERAGMPVEIFALRPCNDTHFQDIIASVRSPVHYLAAERMRSDGLWRALHDAAARSPQFWSQLAEARTEDVREVYQALLLANEIARLDIRHLHAHFATSATTVARLAARFAGVTYSFTAHAKDIYHTSVQPADLRRKLRDASAVVTVSDYNLAYLRRRHGENAANVRRVYNGLSLAQFPYQAPERRRARIVAVGRLVEKKGFDVLIDACALLAKRGRAFDCEIIGGGELASQLQERIDTLGLQQRVVLSGSLPQGEVIRRVQESAVLAAPCVVGSDSNRDGLPTVLLEAMALGTPCVATDVTGVPEVLRNETTGLGVPQHDAPALATALERLLADVPLRMRLAQAARQLIESRFDTDRNAALLRALFREGVTEGASEREERCA